MSTHSLNENQLEMYKFAQHIENAMTRGLELVHAILKR